MSGSTRDVSGPSPDFYGAKSLIAIWFYFLKIINKLLVDWFSVMNKVLDMFHPWLEKVKFCILNLIYTRLIQFCKPLALTYFRDNIYSLAAL